MIGPGSLGFETYVYLTARAFTELDQQENLRTTEGVFCIEQLKSLRCNRLWAWSRPMIVGGYCHTAPSLWKLTLALKGIVRPLILLIDG